MAREFFIQSKIEEIAEQAGVSFQNGVSLEDMLAALPQPERRRVQLFLQGVKAQSDDRTVQQAADEFLSVASRAWQRRRSR